MTDPLTGPLFAIRPHLSPIKVTINLEALLHNYRSIQARLSPHTRILPVIKADAYGHGAIPTAHTLTTLNVFGFGVASVQEGILLRESGIHQPVLVMGPLQSSHLPDLINYGLTPVISHAETLSRFLELLPRNRSPYPIHVKVDTGLHRLGLNPEDVVSIFQICQQSQSLIRIEGLLTHFADADNPDSTLTKHQLSRFRDLIRHIETAGIPRPVLHVANSAGILFHPDSHFDMVRPGLMLYGYSPKQGGQPSPISLHPVLEASTYIAHLRSLEPGEIVGYNAMFRTKRPSKIAVLPVGYTHGIPRNLTGRGHVLIQGEPAPIIGKICMDMMMVDVTDLPQAKIGQEVRLLGIQGKRSITAEDYATWLETIPYEVLCGIGGKAGREYFPTDHSSLVEREGQQTAKASITP